MVDVNMLQVRELESDKVRREELLRQRESHLEGLQSQFDSQKMQMKASEHEQSVLSSKIDALERQLSLSKELNSSLELKIQDLQVKSMEKDLLVRDWENRYA
jgi:chromosome segregation ATPase